MATACAWLGSEFDLEGEKEQVRWWVKKLGWTVIEGPVPDQRKK